MSRKNKTFLFLSLILAFIFAGGLWLFNNFYAQDTPGTPRTVFDTKDPSFFGVFEGRIPCAGCERVKVALVLYQDPLTQAPAKYVLERINVGKDNQRHIAKGNWTIARGTKADPAATVYRLGTDAPAGFRLYQAADKNILLFLNEDMSLKVGDAGHSYTLNKTY
jgi:hypothetical protein